MTETGGHPGHDEELTERYALGRLPHADRRMYEAHLRRCPECRRLAEEELRLAAGIKAAGREDLRLRLRRRLTESRPRSDIPWPRVIAIAASLVLIVGLGVVRFWVSEGEGPREFPAVAESREEVRESYGKKERTHTPPPVQPGVQNEAGKADASANRAPRAAGKATAPPPPEGKARALRGEGMDTPSAVAAAGIAKEDEELLLQGEILDTGEEAAAAQGRDAVRTEAETHRVAREKGGTESQPSVRLQSMQGVQLLQRPRGELPPSSRQRASVGSRMEAGIRRVNDQLLLTLYPETPFTQSAIDHGRAEWLGPDSLRVTIGGQMIIYRIPQAFQQSIPVR